MPSGFPPDRLLVGATAGLRDGAVAVADSHRLLAVCYQERVTRARGSGVTAGGLPAEALDLTLQRLGRTRDDIASYTVVQAQSLPPLPLVNALDTHRASAATAYLTSPFREAAVVVCDEAAPKVSVWTASGMSLDAAGSSWRGAGFVEVMDRFAGWLGFSGPASRVRFEALARLSPAAEDARLDALLRLGDGEITVDESLEALVARLVAEAGLDVRRRAAIAAGLQKRLGAVLLQWLELVRARSGSAHLAAGGGLFHNSAINSTVKRSGIFDEVFIPVDPGNAGLSVGAAVQGCDGRASSISPFLGPEYSPDEIKLVLENCKLQYSWESEEGAIASAVRALLEGRLVGWFDGPMEWGQRALGARSILANPRAPYVLENLNHFLKRREPWRGYAMSGLEAAVRQHFDGPPTAPFMECDFLPREPHLFEAVLPVEGAAIRMHTVEATARPRFARLLEAFGVATGFPFLVNTSFNGFHEPIVCDPRDAVRVFYGTGLDVLVMDQFVLRK